ncbi:hypothetical protein ACWD6N_33265, partial [Micromonospora sp. NPDC005163]
MLEEITRTTAEATTKLISVDPTLRHNCHAARRLLDDAGAARRTSTAQPSSTARGLGAGARRAEEDEPDRRV